jgi:hypothetical protein
MAIGQNTSYEKTAFTVYSRPEIKHGNPTCGAVKCYTDGSRIKGQDGSGICILVDGEAREHKSIPLGQYPTVFQAKIIAPLNYTHLGTIKIFCGSQAALLALNCPEAKAKTVLATMMALDKLA